MTTFLVPIILIGGLTSVGVYLLLERNLTRMLLGLLVIGNALNLLILIAGGKSGNPPIKGRTSNGQTTTADPLAQGMILTAIVITMGIAAFVLALTYRSYRLNTAEEVTDDPEDVRVARLADLHMNALFLDPLFGRGYPAELVEHYAGRFDGLVRDGDLDTIAGPLGFLGVNYYRPQLIAADPSRGAGPVAAPAATGARFT